MRQWTHKQIARLIQNAPRRNDWVEEAAVERLMVLHRATELALDVSTTPQEVQAVLIESAEGYDPEVRRASEASSETPLRVHPGR